MAKRRMFSLDIVDTDQFLELPCTAQSLYFHLGMRADDDGFISSPNKITKIASATDTDFKMLIDNKYIIRFEKGICVVAHWNQNNQIRKDRHTDTIYTQQKSCLQIDSNNTYILEQ